jgi:hypothetical protein
MHGIPVVAVGDLPAGRMFPVTATLKGFGGRVGVQWEVVFVHVREGQIAGTGSMGHVTLCTCATWAPAAITSPSGAAEAHYRRRERVRSDCLAEFAGHDCETQSQRHLPRRAAVCSGTRAVPALLVCLAVNNV